MHSYLYVVAIIHIMYMHLIKYFSLFINLKLDSLPLWHSSVHPVNLKMLPYTQNVLHQSRLLPIYHGIITTQPYLRPWLYLGYLLSENNQSFSHCAGRAIWQLILFGSFISQKAFIVSNHPCTWSKQFHKALWQMEVDNRTCN